MTEGITIGFIGDYTVSSGREWISDLTNVIDYIFENYYRLTILIGGEEEFEKVVRDIIENYRHRYYIPEVNLVLFSTYACFNKYHKKCYDGVILSNDRDYISQFVKECNQIICCWSSCNINKCEQVKNLAQFFGIDCQFIKID